jgi:hypothetical protein
MIEANGNTKQHKASFVYTENFKSEGLGMKNALYFSVSVSVTLLVLSIHLGMAQQSKVPERAWDKARKEASSE